MKTRLFYGFAILLTVALGLSTRKFSSALPGFVAMHFGDALWAAMVYFGFRLLLPHKSKLLSLGLCLVFSFFIEFSQLYQATWLNNLRASTLGALVLGRGFLWIDLLRYTAGALFAFLADESLRKKTRTYSRQNS